MTLTEISYYSRRLAPFAVLLFLLTLILFYSVKLLFIFINLQNKTSTLPVNTVFGPLKRPQIPEATLSKGYKFTLDTVEGEPITASDTARVLLLPPSKPNALYREKIYLIAKTIGFNTETVTHKLVENNTEAVFEDDNQSLSLDVSRYNFTYKYFFEKTPEIFDLATAPEKITAESRANDFLNSIGKYPKELTQGKTNVIYLSFNPNEKSVTNAENKSSANLVEVDYYRPDIDGFPTVSSKYFNSSNYVLLTFDGNDYRILRAQIRFFEKSEAQDGVYPLKSGKEAYESLKNGKGLVTSNPLNETDVVIKKMFLAYYEPEKYQAYLQPVYVFLGENNFVAYVPAIKDEFLVE